MKAGTRSGPRTCAPRRIESTWPRYRRRGAVECAQVAKKKKKAKGQAPRVRDKPKAAKKKPAKPVDFQAAVLEAKRQIREEMGGGVPPDADFATQARRWLKGDLDRDSRYRQDGMTDEIEKRANELLSRLDERDGDNKRVVDTVEHRLMLREFRKLMGVRESYEAKMLEVTLAALNVSVVEKLQLHRDAIQREKHSTPEAMLADVERRRGKAK